jgi:hypothetical protein
VLQHLDEGRDARAQWHALFDGLQGFFALFFGFAAPAFGFGFLGSHCGTQRLDGGGDLLGQDDARP